MKSDNPREAVIVPRLSGRRKRICPPPRDRYRCSLSRITALDPGPLPVAKKDVAQCRRTAIDAPEEIPVIFCRRTARRLTIY